MKKMNIVPHDKGVTGREITLYHGTVRPDLVPVYGTGFKYNDYGQGFYTTEDFELACEWACGRDSESVATYVFEYVLPLTDLRVFDFRSIEKMVALTWVTELLKHRSLSPSDDPYGVVSQLIQRFDTDADSHDLIVGPRADDSYFSYAQAFVRGVIGVGELSECLKAGDLGTQYCIKSQKCFDCLRFVQRHVLQGKELDKYRKRYETRDGQARDFAKSRIKGALYSGNNDITIRDIFGRGRK